MPLLKIEIDLGGTIEEFKLDMLYGKEIKGSKSWFGFGGFGVQPAEFMKFATNLALAKFLSNANLNVDDTRQQKESVK